MRVFLLLVLTCGDIERSLNAYWWGFNQGQEKRIRWMSWEILKESKSKGGMGFRRLYKFNMELLAKQGWCLLTRHKFFVVHALKAKYYPNSSILKAK